MPTRRIFLEKIQRRAGEPFCAAPFGGAGAGDFFRETIFQTGQPATHSKASAVRVLPGMRSRRGNRNSPSPAVTKFADQMPAQTGMAPWCASVAPIVNIK